MHHIHGLPFGICWKKKNANTMHGHSRIATGSNMDSIWEAKRLLAASSLFGLSGACWFLVVKLVAPPIWHSPVPGMGKGGSANQVGKVVVSAPLVYHIIDGIPVFSSVVGDKAVGIALPSPVPGVATFGSCGSQAWVSPFKVCSKLVNGTGGSLPVSGKPVSGKQCQLIFPTSGPWNGLLVGFIAACSGSRAGSWVGCRARRWAWLVALDRSFGLWW